MANKANSADAKTTRLISDVILQKYKWSDPMISKNGSTQNEVEESEAAAPEVRIVCGFWRRLLAFIIDGILLGAVGLILGAFLFDFFAQLGGWGRLIGFCIALVYFGLLNSSIGKGQTIGKRIMRIEVSDSEGNHISPMRSFIRYTILAVPFFLNEALLPPSIVMSPIGYLIGIVIFGCGGAIVYLYIFNRRTRQSVHDLAVRTFVVRTSPSGVVAAPSVWKGHFVLVGIWFLLVIGFLVAVPLFTQKGVFPELLAVQKSIQSSGKVHLAIASVGKSWGTTEGKKWETTYFHLDAVWKTRPDDYQAAAAEIASIVLGEYSEIMQKDVLAVTVTYGYDIGIAQSWIWQKVEHRPQEWLEILQKPQV